MVRPRTRSTPSAGTSPKDSAATHREFARFLRISRRSLNELQDAFEGALEKGHVTPADQAPARMQLRRLYPAFTGFLAYLDRTPDHRHRRPDKGADRPKPRGTDKRE
jgi:hypothetical protein